MPAKLLKKPVFITIGVLFAAFGLYWALDAWQAGLLAEAEERERQAVQALADKEKIEAEAKAAREQHERERQEWAEQQAQLTRSILARNEATERRIALALTPKPAEQVGREAKETLGITPTPTAAGFTVTVQEMQELIATRLDRDRLAENLRETEHQLQLERQQSDTLRLDLQRTTKVLEESTKTIQAFQSAMKAYEAAAKKSKWRKVGDFALKGGMAVALGYLGAKAAQ